jgi:hypothetical protein
VKYLTFTQVDAVSGLPANEALMNAGPAYPAIAGLTFGFALESQYPIERPVFYGTCDDGADLALPGVLGEVTQAEYEAAEAAEMVAREPAAPDPLRPLSPYQFWGVVKATGYEDDLRDLVAAIEDPVQKAFSESMLEYSLEFRRDHPLVEQMRVALGMSEEELNALWAFGHNQ